jgi:predicted dehydrogenase
MKLHLKEEDEMEKMNVAIIGTKFMGKAHSNAWANAPRFFDLGIKPVMKVAVGKSEESAQALANNWGWEEISSDWQEVVERDDIDVIDISVPTNLHHPIAVAAARAGKHIFCEKPFALNASQAKEMLDEAEKAGVIHYLNHNYRRCPAVQLAKKLIDEGEIGTIFHWRSAYLQDWIVDPNFPLTWHLQKEFAGGGVFYDLGSHIIDLSRYLIGEVKSVSAMQTTFIGDRPLPGEGAATFTAGKGSDAETGQVTVDDATFMIAELEGGVLGSYEVSRFSPGRKNFNYFEIYGSKGSIVFNLERMNELQLFLRDDPEYAQGFKTIIVTEGVHAYLPAWWPPGHVIGYEHEFHHAVVDFMSAIERNEEIHPNFFDGLREMLVIEAGLKSAEIGKKVEVPE